MDPQSHTDQSAFRSDHPLCTDQSAFRSDHPLCIDLLDLSDQTTLFAFFKNRLLPLLNRCYDPTYQSDVFATLFTPLRHRFSASHVTLTTARNFRNFLLHIGIILLHLIYFDHHGTEHRKIPPPCRDSLEKLKT